MFNLNLIKGSHRSCHSLHLWKVWTVLAIRILAQVPVTLTQHWEARISRLYIWRKHLRLWLFTLVEPQVTLEGQSNLITVVMMASMMMLFIIIIVITHHHHNHHHHQSPPAPRLLSRDCYQHNNVYPTLKKRQWDVNPNPLHAKFLEETKTYIHILCHASTLARHRQFKSLFK